MNAAPSTSNTTKLITFTQKIATAEKGNNNERHYQNDYTLVL